MYYSLPVSLPSKIFEELEKNKRYKYLRNIMYFMAATPEEQEEWRAIMRPLVLEATEKQKQNTISRNKELAVSYRRAAVSSRSNVNCEKTLDYANRYEMWACAVEQCSEEELEDYFLRDKVENMYHGLLL